MTTVTTAPDIEALIDRVVKAAEEFKGRPMKPASKTRIKRALRRLCNVAPQLGLERVERIELSS